MQKLIQTLRRLVPGQAPVDHEFHFNRVAQASSHDRALAAFKDEQMRIARNRMASRAIVDVGQ